MITTKPTKNLTGINIQGDFNDFYELVEILVIRSHYLKAQ